MHFYVITRPNFRDEDSEEWDPTNDIDKQWMECRRLWALWALKQYAGQSQGW